MSYTPPLGNAANASWLTQLPYTPPTSTEVSVSWVSGPREATGWLSTSLGQPAGSAQFAGQAAHVLPGAQFGQPALRSAVAALSLPPTLLFGTPSTPHLKSVQASGGNFPRFGLAFAQKVTTQALGRIVGVPGTQLGTLGTPAARWQRFCVAAPHTASRMGSPNCRRRQGSSGFSPPSFGTPTSTQRQPAADFVPAMFGVPAAKFRAAAVGFQTFSASAPEASRSRRAAGLLAGRKFGNPTARVVVRRTYSINASRRFGRPTARKQT